MDDCHSLIETVPHFKADPVAIHKMGLPRTSEKIAPGLLRDKAELRRFLKIDPLWRISVGTQQDDMAQIRISTEKIVKHGQKIEALESDEGEAEARAELLRLQGRNLRAVE